LAKSAEAGVFDKITKFLELLEVAGCGFALEDSI